MWIRAERRSIRPLQQPAAGSAVGLDPRQLEGLERADGNRASVVEGFAPLLGRPCGARSLAFDVAG